MRLAVAMVVAACGASPPQPIANERMAPPEEHLLPVAVHGTVLDYANRRVEGASVSVSRQEGSIERKTDRDGRFELRAPKRAFVSASKHDMLGHVELGDAADQTIVIKMAQMPM